MQALAASGSARFLPSLLLCRIPRDTAPAFLTDPTKQAAWEVPAWNHYIEERDVLIWLST